jgi:hypothetical protein
VASLAVIAHHVVARHTPDVAVVEVAAIDVAIALAIDFASAHIRAIDGAVRPNANAAGLGVMASVFATGAANAAALVGIGTRQRAAVLTRVTALLRIVAIADAAVVTERSTREVRVVALEVAVIRVAAEVAIVAVGTGAAAVGATARRVIVAATHANRER